MKSFLPFESSGACESVSSWVWHLSHFDCMNAPLYLRPITFTPSVSGSFQSWSSSPWRKARWRTPLVWTPWPPWQVVQPNVSGLCALVRSSQRWGCVRKTGLTSNGSVFTASSSAATVSLSEQACATLSSTGFSSPSIASRAGLREMPFHSGFCSTSTAPLASLRTVFVFANQRAFGPQYASATSIHFSHVPRGRHSVAWAGSIGEGSAGGGYPPMGTASGGRGTSSQTASWIFWYASTNSGSTANWAFMSASGRFAFFASTTSHGAEYPPLLMPTWQFWQRSTVGAPQEFLRFSI